MQFQATLPARLRRIGRAVVDAVLPPRCLTCGVVVGEPDAPVRDVLERDDVLRDSVVRGICLALFTDRRTRWPTPAINETVGLK